MQFLLHACYRLKQMNLFSFPTCYLIILFLVLETDRPDPALTQAEIKYVPEQM